MQIENFQFFQIGWFGMKYNELLHHSKRNFRMNDFCKNLGNRTRILTNGEPISCEQN